MTDPILYRWPPKARFDRVVPKSRFYEHGRFSTALRGKFVADVRRIIWAYKLADTTIHLRGDAAVPEIQVFVVDAKEADVADDVLTAIDKTVPFPIIFEINSTAENGGRVRMVAAHKVLDGGKPRLSAYFSTDWLPADAPRKPLPPALDLPSLYGGLLMPILPVRVRAGEPLPEATARMNQARKLKREIATFERRLRSEPQFNRRVELFREIRDRTEMLTMLTDIAQHRSEDKLRKATRWTS